MVITYNHNVNESAHCFVVHIKADMILPFDQSCFLLLIILKQRILLP